jgi:hypothetical protein
MTGTIRFDVTNARQVGLRFEAFPDALYEDLRREIDALSNELFMRVQALTPSRSGDLRSKERLRLFTDKTRITGYIDIAGEKGSQDFAKAGALEYGTRGRANKVSAHAMKLDHYWSQKLVEPVTVLTRSFERTPNVAQFAFERGALATYQPEVASRLNAVVDNAVKDFNA